MKKQLLNIGKVLSSAEQKKVFGGNKTMEDGEDSGCLTTGAYCRTDAHQKCCGSCDLITGRNGTCID